MMTCCGAAWNDDCDCAEWQTECVQRGVGGGSLLVSLPTSGGKTLVAELLLLRTLLVHKKHAIFVLPYVAIVQEKVKHHNTVLHLLLIFIPFY